MMDEHQNRYWVTRQVRINDEGVELTINSLVFQAELAEILLIEISRKLGNRSFDFEDIDELKSIICDYIKNNRSGFVMNEIAMGRAVSYESGTILHMEYLEKMSNGRWEFDKDIFWVVAEIFECEVIIFYESGGKFVYGKGKSNEHFGTLEFLINNVGEIEIISSKQVILEEGLVMDEIIITTDGNEEKWKTGGNAGNEIEGTKKLKVGDAMNETLTTKSKVIVRTGLKECIIQGLVHSQDKGEMNDHALQRVEEFFKEYEQMERLVYFARVEGNEGNWEILCKLAEKLSREIIFVLPDGKEKVVGVSEGRSKNNSLMIKVVRGMDRNTYFTICNTDETDEANRKKDITELLAVEYCYNGNNIQKISRMLQDKSEKLLLRKIPGDGNCLLRAILDQIGRLAGKTYVSDWNVRKLRMRIADYIKNNRDRFEIFLYEYLEVEENFDAVISKFKQDGFWLGQEALVAASEIFEVAILVIVQDGTKYSFGEQYADNGTLKVFYSGFPIPNHYDSVLEITNATGRTGDRKKIEEMSENKIKTIEIADKQKIVNNDTIEDINTDGNDGRQEVVLTQKDRRVVKIVSWNIRGCRNDSKREEIDEVLITHDIDVAVMQEANTLGDEISTKN